MKIGVVGGGVAGIVAAHLLQRKHEVVLFEANDDLGGHTNTRVIENGPDAGTAVDTGFIVLNDKNYPTMHRFLKSLDVPVRWSDMSFAYYCRRSGLQYAGTTLNGLFAQRGNLFSREYLAFLWEIRRFCVEAAKAIGTTELETTLGEFLKRRSFSPYMIEHYLLPMGAAIWSAQFDDIFAFPARTFVEFFKNHGLLGFTNRPRWQTVVGGSQSYVKRFKELFGGKVFTSCPVKEVRRSESKVELVDSGGGLHTLDRVVIASHADQALGMLADPTPDERRILGAWRYETNDTVLHTDRGLLPPLKRAWASWNYLRFENSGNSSPVVVTYHMNRLQGLRTEQDYCVTLNCPDRIDPKRVLYSVRYTHPSFTADAVRLQPELESLQGVRNTYFCGSYFGYGFHEDAVKAGAAVALAFDVEL